MKALNICTCETNLQLESGLLYLKQPPGSVEPSKVCIQELGSMVYATDWDGNGCVPQGEYGAMMWMC